jgi:hypothetical protein
MVLLCKFALDYSIKWVKQNGRDLFINDGIHSVQKNREIISKEASQVSVDRTKCMYMSCEQNVGQNYNVKIGNI